MLSLTLPGNFYSVNKVLHMDRQPSDPSLQKTSPSPDPATIYQLSTELSAQAAMLATHQHQLTHLTTLTEELVRTLQALHAPASPSPPQQAPPPPAALSTAAAPSAGPRLAFPEKFDGTPAKCKGFLLQCSLFVDQQPSLYPTDQARIAFVCSLLSGRALDWATAVWSYDRPTFPSFTAFIRRF
ncbi:MAG: DUF4939 domain-containing protein, partial [Cetobacterium sp.]